MVEFDADTREFLGALKNGTRKTYTPGLKAFQTFYGKSPKHFLDAIEKDLQEPRRQRKRVARNTLKGFVEWMEKKKLAPKTISTYITAVQSLATYFDLKVSKKYIDMPEPLAVSSKFPWTLETVVKLVNMIEILELKSIAVTIFQSGLSVADILALNYGDIKYEYEQSTIPLCLDRAVHGREKTKVSFMTFIGAWGVSLLQKHLKGRTFKMDTSLYNMAHRTIDDKFQGLAEKFVGEYRGWNPVRPHSLRAGFRTLLGDAGMDRDVVKFLMGQKLPEQDRAYHSRSREGWRRQYKKYMFALEPKEFARS